MDRTLSKNLWKIGLAVAVIALFVLPLQTHAAPPELLDLFSGGWWGDSETGLLACDGNICDNLCQLLELLNNLLFFGLTILLYVIAPIRFIIGGFLIMTSGTSEGLSRGKSMIKGTVIGILIALGGFVIVATFLWLIGNNSVESGKPRVAWPEIACQPGAAPYPTSTTGGGSGGTTGGGSGGGLGQGDQGCPSCIVFGGGDIIFKAGVGNKAAEKMVDAIYCFDNKVNMGIRVTEAYPPTYQGHRSLQHYNGCAIDFTIDLTPAAFVYANAIGPAARECGLASRNEYNDPSPQATGNHIHIQLPTSQCP